MHSRLVACSNAQLTRLSWHQNRTCRACSTSKFCDVLKRVRPLHWSDSFVLLCDWLPKHTLCSDWLLMTSFLFLGKYCTTTRKSLDTKSELRRFNFTSHPRFCREGVSHWRPSNYQRSSLFNKAWAPFSGAQICQDFLAKRKSV